MACGSASRHVSGNATSVSLNLLTEEPRVTNPSGNAGEPGRDSPLRRGVIMSCAATAIYKMNGCQQPGWCVLK